jgi:protein SCO1/2
MSRIVSVLLLAALALGLVSCQPTRAYHVKGVVKEVLPDRNKVKIDHEEIPGYMDAMTMVFDVKDPKELAGLQPGDTVFFRMVVTETDGWIEQVQKLAVPTPVATNAPETFRVVPEVEPLKVGDLMPDYRFTNELGQVVRLSDFKGQALAFTFMFTRCPFPTFCPRMSGNFAEAAQKLPRLSNAPTNWHLLSITIDPQFDTPAVLLSYARRYKADPQRWNHVTGDLIDITAIGEQFGLLFWRPDPNQPAGISHNLRTVVVDVQGRVQRIFSENEWKVDELVEEMVKAAGVKL